jgi:hypothetical protein
MWYVLNVVQCGPKLIPVYRIYTVSEFSSLRLSKNLDHVTELGERLSVVDRVVFITAQRNISIMSFD